ncbi:MAG: hypothetical protein QOH23_965 [Gaiellaceae bacterium]|jgi:hypothetical protein|nr:hypothetical protein [Gaiellaceae bacterium]
MNEPNLWHSEEELSLATRYCRLSEAGHSILDALELASRRHVGSEDSADVPEPSRHADSTAAHDGPTPRDKRHSLLSS